MDFQKGRTGPPYPHPLAAPVSVAPTYYCKFFCFFLKQLVKEDIFNIVQAMLYALCKYHICPESKNFAFAKCSLLLLW